MPKLPQHFYSISRKFGKKETPLNQLFIQATAQRYLLRAVKRSLPERLGLHCVGCLVKGHQLLLFTDSPAWSSRLHYYTITLLQRLQQRGYAHLEYIKIRVVTMPSQQSTIPTQPELLKRQPLSQANTVLIRDTAIDIKTPQLKAALNRLAERRGTSSLSSEKN